MTRSGSGLRVGGGTVALGLAAAAAAVGVGALEFARVWHRGSAPLPRDRRELLVAGRVATRETIEVLRYGAHATPRRENVLFNMLAAFAATFGLTRAITGLIRSGLRFGVRGNVVVGRRHVHHFVPGMLLAFAASGTAIAIRGDDLDRWLAIPFGAGTALVFDEAALLLELEDVYWSEQGVLSIQLSFAAIVLLSLLALAVRVLRRGEGGVLGAPG